MIESKSLAVLYINKLSVLLVSLMLVMLWLNIDSSKPSQSNPTKTKQNHSTQSHQSNESKYLKTLPVNPFLNRTDEVSSDDNLPTITLLQSAIPALSSLQLRLHGIVYQYNKNSYAMISMKSAIQEIVSVNGEISEGLYLTKISKKQVEVDYFGEKHILSINKTRNTSFIERPSENNSEDISKLSFNQQIEYLEVDKHRNPIRLFMIRRPYAVYSNGEFQGYKVMPGSNADQFKRLGFKSGDIITYLNGIEFTGPGNKEFVIQQLTHAMHIDLTVLRDNQELSIHYGF